MAVDTQITEIDLAWAAGFIDGEGSIGFYRQSNPKYEFHYLRLSVANTDLRALERLKTLFSGSIHRTNHIDRPNCRPCWTWYCQSAKCAAALELLLPYLFVKKEQAEIALLSRKYMRQKGQFRLSEKQREGQRDIAKRLSIVK